MTIISGTITNIERQQKRRDRVNVYIDDRFAFSLSNIVTEGAALRKGDQLTREKIDDLLSLDQFQKALDSALHFISYRPRSEKEVRQNLIGKRFSETFIDRIIERLKEMRMIDDVEFARFWVENRDAYSPRSHRALKFELRAKGVASEILDEALDEAVDQDVTATEAGRKKVKSLKGLEYKDFRQRLGAYLARRGYDYETAKRAVDLLWNETRDVESGGHSSPSS